MINRTQEEQKLQDQYVSLVSITGQALSLARAIRDLVLHEKMADLNMAANQAVGVYRSLEFAKGYLADKMLKLPTQFTELDDPPPMSSPCETEPVVHGWIKDPTYYRVLYYPPKPDNTITLVKALTELDPQREAFVCWRCCLAPSLSGIHNAGYAAMTGIAMYDHLRAHLYQRGTKITVEALNALGYNDKDIRSAESGKPPQATTGFIENPEKHTTVYHDQDVFLVVAEDTILDPIRKALVCYECHMANLGHSFASLTKSEMKKHLQHHMVSAAAMGALDKVPLPD